MTKFTSITQVPDLKEEFLTTTITLKSKKGKEIQFFLKEVDPRDYFKIKGFKDMAKTAAKKKSPVDIAGNFDSGLKIAAACLTDDKYKPLIDEDADKLVSFLRSTFSLEQLSNLIEAMMGLCGFTKDSQKKIEKN